MHPPALAVPVRLWRARLLTARQPCAPTTAAPAPCPSLLHAPLITSSAAALAAGPEQIHLSYTGVLGQLAVDFVCANGTGSVSYSIDAKKTWATAPATHFTYASIGELQQALIAPVWTPAPGAALSYYCACADGSKSNVFDVTPVPARYPSEVRGGCKGG